MRRRGYSDSPHAIERELLRRDVAVRTSECSTLRSRKPLLFDIKAPGGCVV